MANYWIKLYHEILDDPLMATMPDQLWRRTIELFLICGRFGADGLLPDSKQIAWILRIDVDQVETDLIALSELGILSQTESGWVVTNFSKRQAPSSATERSRKWRESQRSNQYNGNENETKMQRNVAQITDTDRIDTEQNSPQLDPTPEAVLFEQACAVFSEHLSLTNERKKVLFDIRTNPQFGAAKFMTACHNLAASDWPTKSITYFIDKKFDAQNRVDLWANGGPPRNGPTEPELKRNWVGGKPI